MYWQDEKKESQRYVVPDDVIDISYDISCRTLPVDHAYALQQGLRRACPWLDQEEGVGVHSIPTLPLKLGKARYSHAISCFLRTNRNPWRP